MAKTLAASHIVCLPSSYGEGIPKVLLEAAAIGRPIVASDIAGCREIVEAGRSGVLVPEKDPAALAEALALLLDSKETRLRYGQRARDKAVAEFDIKQVVRETLLVYRSMIAR
jgi:glycosyltransferase involved in cell wall biosynthesis